MADKVKEVAAEEAERLKALTAEAVKSRAYLYPFKVAFPWHGMVGGADADRTRGSLLLRCSQKLMATIDV